MKIGRLPYLISKRVFFMITFDLKSGYHHIEIHSDHPRFLGIAWKFPGEASIRYFVFSVLPFGLSSAPYFFFSMS